MSDKAAVATALANTSSDAAIGFAVGGPVGAGVGAAVGITSTIIAGILNNQETDKANKQNLALANQQRSDELAARKQTQQNWQAEMNVNQQNTAFNQNQTKYQNAVNKEQTGFNRQQDAYNNAVKMLSTQDQLVQNRTAPFIKRV
jgi:uncharacterized membrane protein YhiD involved in acid resistance